VQTPAPKAIAFDNTETGTFVAEVYGVPDELETDLCHKHGVRFWAELPNTATIIPIGVRSAKKIPGMRNLWRWIRANDGMVSGMKLGEQWTTEQRSWNSYLDCYYPCFFQAFIIVLIQFFYLTCRKKTTPR
jgi:hypothetical protein